MIWHDFDPFSELFRDYDPDGWWSPPIGSILTIRKGTSVHRQVARAIWPWLVRDDELPWTP